MAMSTMIIFFSALLGSLPEYLDCRVGSKGSLRRKVHDLTQLPAIDLRRSRSAPNGHPRFSVTRHEACAGGRLSRAHESTGRSGLEAP